MVTADEARRELARRELARRRGQGELKAYEPGIIESLGNRLYDAANALGLPASPMRREAQGVDAFVRGAADVPTFGFADELSAGAAALERIL